MARPTTTRARRKERRLFISGVYIRLEAVDAVAVVAKIDAPAAVPALYRVGRTSAHQGAFGAGGHRPHPLAENRALTCAGVQDGADPTSCRSGGIGRRTRFRV